jgi:flagellar basal-body rod protein FlgC
MDILTSFKICSSGLTAQRAKMDVTTSNLANVETTRTPEGGPYKRKTVVLAAEPVTDAFGTALNAAVRAVKIDRIAEDGAVKMLYDPSHPDADDKGYVAKPNVNPIMEMADMINTSRNYEAIVTAFDATKNMALRTFDMGK